jgi:hypothetical protein
MIKSLSLCGVLSLLLITACAPNPGGEPVDPPMEEDHSGSIEESVVVPNPAESTEPGTAEIIGGDEDSLREFMEWYLASPGSTGTTRAFIGSLPDNLSFDVPMPDGARVIGSVASDQQFSYTQILLEIEGSQEDIQAFYTEAFSGEDRTQPQMGQQGGFVSGMGPQLSYCNTSADAALNITMAQKEQGLVGVTLMVQKGLQYSACASQVMGDPHGDASMMIPLLSAPQGSQQMQQGGGGGSGTGFIDAHQSAAVITDLTPAELADHYNEQIHAAGWTQVTKGGDDNTVWSTWTLTDDEGKDWTARLIIFRRSTKNGGLFAWIQVEQLFSD